jgi:hypothetical protein
MRTASMAILVILLVTISSSAYAQLTSEEIEDQNRECVVRYKTNASDRRQNYPFNLASEVRLVSFDFISDSTTFERRLPKKNKRVDVSKLLEQVALTDSQVDSLTYILFNVGYRGKVSTGLTRFCYEPRNAILFMNLAGQPFEFIEICFECIELRLSSRSIKTGEFCDQKYDLLKAFFKRRGIEFGTTDQ